MNNIFLLFSWYSQSAIDGVRLSDSTSPGGSSNDIILDRINNMGGIDDDEFTSVIQDGTGYIAVGNSSSDLSSLTGGTTNVGADDFVISEF